MARILAIDTTADLGSAALIEDDRVVDEVSLRAPDGFSPVIFGAIQELLQRHGWPLESVDCFAGASGPGSFTGVRVCLTAIKGLAEATGAAVPAAGSARAPFVMEHATANAESAPSRRRFMTALQQGPRHRNRHGKSSLEARYRPRCAHRGAPPHSEFCFTAKHAGRVVVPTSTIRPQVQGNDTNAMHHQETRRRSARILLVNAYPDRA